MIKFLYLRMEYIYKTFAQIFLFSFCLLVCFANCFGQTNVPAGNVSGRWTKAKSPLALYLSGKEVEKNTEKFQVYPVRGGYIMMEKDKNSLNLLFFSDSVLSGKR